MAAGLESNQNISTQEFKKEKQFLSVVEGIAGIELSEKQNLELLRWGASPGSIVSFWDAFRIIAFHSFKSRKIVQSGAELIPIKTKKQFKYYFRSRQDIETLGDLTFECEEEENRENGREEAYTPNTVLCYDGAGKTQFEEFYDYILLRVQGKLDRQVKRRELSPLLVWKKRFKDSLLVFFKAKIGGNGYARDYLDKKIRELQRKKKKIAGLDEAALVKDAFMDAIETGDFSNRDYTCMIAGSRGHSAKAISRFTGFSVKEIKETIESAIPKASVIIYRMFCLKYQQPETEEGCKVTEKLVRQILAKST